MDWQALQARTNTAVLAAFGEAVTLNGVALQGDFCEDYAVGNVGSYGLATTQPALVLATPLVPANPVGLTCVARGTTYRVATAEADGCGMTRLLLVLP